MNAEETPRCVIRVDKEGETMSLHRLKGDGTIEGSIDVSSDDFELLDFVIGKYMTVKYEQGKGFWEVRETPLTDEERSLQGIVRKKDLGFLRGIKR